MPVLVSNGASLLAEAFVVGVYLVFLLFGVRQFGHRVQAVFGPARAELVLYVIGRINEATTRYLRSKTLASPATGIPTAMVLWGFEVRYPVMWGALAFFGNFSPFVGSMVAFASPLVLTYLNLKPAWCPWALALLLILIQVVTNILVERTLTGKAVDLSPLVTLVSLAFWGLTGMLLAIPLTAMLKIGWGNMPSTRPLAALMAEGEE